MADIGRYMELQRERRRETREWVEIDVFLSCERGGEQPERYSVQDMSLNGMALKTTADELQIGEKMCLCLPGVMQPCSSDHVIEASVVHRRKGMAGIRFDSVGISILKDLQRLLHGERTF